MRNIYNHLELDLFNKQLSQQLSHLPTMYNEKK